MKKYCLLALIFATALANAQNTVNSTPKLKEATVFNQGAELSYTATVALAKGENEVLLTGLSPVITQNSIKVEASGGAVISSSELSSDYLTDVKTSERLKRLQDSITLYNKKSKQVQNDIKINTDMLSVLEKGVKHNVTNEKEASSTDRVTHNLEYYKNKAKELNNNILSLNDQKEEISKTLTRLNKQLKEESTGKSKKTSQLRLAVSAPLAGNVTFAVKYFTTQAGWVPEHHIVVAAEDKPVQITTKAKVMQYTGLDWNNVKITLSTGMPSLHNTAPEMDAWFLKPVTSYVGGLRKKKNARTEEELEYVEDDIAIENNVYYGGNRRDATEIKTMLFFVNGTEVSESEMEQLASNEIKTREILSPDETKSRFGYLTKQGSIVVTTKNMDDYVSQSEDDLNRLFNIDLKYSIPGNGKEQYITIGKQETAATYRYYCVPKLDPSTFLMAEINNWEKLNLLSGNANISFAGSYVGNTYIDANSTKKTLSLTLGIDNKVVVTRKKVKDYSSSKILGSDVKVATTYEITVKNNKNKNILLTVKDQYPVSTNKKIDVELQKETSTPTTNNEKTGIMTWDTEVKAAQSHKITLSYTVKYPKDMTLKIE
ncbi:MAG: DUF4139 domain-containing protein [Bacteroidales bacterium]|nr:DUF4139 domain-containing protein [Bacteroidales bacterium]